MRDHVSSAAAPSPRPRASLRVRSTNALNMTVCRTKPATRRTRRSERTAPVDAASARSSSHSASSGAKAATASCGWSLSSCCANSARAGTRTFGATFVAEEWRHIA